MNSHRLRNGFAICMACVGVFLAMTVITVVLPAEQPAASPKAGSILILKKDHVMELFAEGKVIRTYKMALGRGGLAPKEREGMGALRRAATSLTRKTQPATITRLCTSRIPKQAIAIEQRSWASRQAGRS